MLQFSGILALLTVLQGISAVDFPACKFNCFLATKCNSQVLTCADSVPSEYRSLLLECVISGKVVIIGTKSQANNERLIADYLDPDLITYLTTKGGMSTILIYSYLSSVTSESLIKPLPKGSYSLFLNVARTVYYDPFLRVDGNIEFGLLNSDYIPLSSDGPPAKNYILYLTRCQYVKATVDPFLEAACYCRTFYRAQNPISYFPKSLEMIRTHKNYRKQGGQCGKVNDYAFCSKGKMDYKGEYTWHCRTCCQINATDIQTRLKLPVQKPDYCYPRQRGGQSKLIELGSPSVFFTCFFTLLSSYYFS